LASTNSSIKAVLRQLDKGQLVRLARQRNVKKTALEMPKPTLVDFLSHIITRKEINELLSKRGRTGAFAMLDGVQFEKKAMRIFTKDGYNCSLNVRMRGMEFDIIGKKGRDYAGFYDSTKYVIAECKNKGSVNMQDFNKFLGKFRTYERKHDAEGQCFGFFVTTGIYHPDVKRAVKTHKEIKLLRVKS
jgi:hypothetical protein